MKFLSLINQLIFLEFHLQVKLVIRSASETGQSEGSVSRRHIDPVPVTEFSVVMYVIGDQGCTSIRGRSPAQRNGRPCGARDRQGGWCRRYPIVTTH